MFVREDAASDQHTGNQEWRTKPNGWIRVSDLTFNIWNGGLTREAPESPEKVFRKRVKGYITARAFGIVEWTGKL